MSSFRRRVSLLVSLLLLFPWMVESREHETKSHETRVLARLQGTCGNEIIDDGEQCDGSNLGDATCASLGFDGGELGCDSSCAFDLRGCVDAVCGNEQKEGAEECDDGNTTSGDGCSENCTLENVTDQIVQAFFASAPETRSGGGRLVSES